MGVGEARRMLMVEGIVMAYRSRGRSENWTEWAQKSPDANALLMWATRVTHGE